MFSHTQQQKVTEDLIFLTIQFYTFENFGKIWVVGMMLGTFDLTVFILSQCS